MRIEFFFCEGFYQVRNFYLQSFCATPQRAGVLFLKLFAHCDLEKKKIALLATQYFWPMLESHIVVRGLACYVSQSNR